jgi:predicted TIM-barrel fold metal-dependent hydrolase
MKGDARPSTESLLAKLHEWTSDSDTLTRILVTNPAALYGFPPIGT